MLEEAVDYLEDKVFMDESKSFVKGLESLRLLLEKALIEAKKESLNVSELKCSQEASVKNCEDVLKLVKKFLAYILLSTARYGRHHAALCRSRCALHRVLLCLPVPK